MRVHPGGTLLIAEATAAPSRAEEREAVHG
jgi:hypothetical protein